MRKFTILLAMVAFATFAFGQKGFMPAKTSFSKADPTAVANKRQQVKEDIKSSRNVIWYEDFNGATWSGTSVQGEPAPQNTPEGWELVDFNERGWHFRWDTVGPSGNYTSPGDDCNEPNDPLFSTTGHNGFMMLELDDFNTSADCSSFAGLTQNAAIVYNGGLDFTDHQAVHLVFEQTHRFCCAPTDDIYFEVSTDQGDTWEGFSVREAPNNYTPGNAFVGEYDISTLVGGESDVWFRFHLEGYIVYHWEIDDVRFVEPIDNDMRIEDYWNDYIVDFEPSVDIEDSNDFYGGFYSYPWFVVQDFESFSLALQNYGGVTQNNIVHNVEVKRNGAVIESYNTSVASAAPGIKDTTELDITDSLMLPGKGVYEFVHYSTTDEGDENDDNNWVSREMAITDSTLSPVDMTTVTGSAAPTDWADVNDGAGLAFEVEIPDPSLHGTASDEMTLKGLRVYVRDNQRDHVEDMINAGAASFEAQVWVYNTATEEYDLKVSSAPYTLSAADIGNFVRIDFPEAGDRTISEGDGGDYFINLKFNGISSGERMVNVGENDSQKAGLTAGYLVLTDPNGTVYLGKQAMIELIVDYTAAYPSTEYDATFTVDDGTNPIEGATVYVGGKSASTDVNGDVTIALEDGSYPYTVVEDGYGDVEGTIDVAGAAVSETVSMSVEYMTYFEVTNEAGSYLSNAKIAINEENLSTGADGVDSLALVNGSYDYMVSLLGYDTLTGSVTVADAEQTVEIQLTQSMPYTVDFTVTDLEATPIEGATLTFGGTDYTTDASGLVSVSAPFGSSVYTVAAAGYQTFVGSVVVTESMQKTVELNPLHMLTINVEDAAGTAIEGATVTIEGMEAQTTDATGAVTFEVIDGTYEATASMEGYVDNSTTVEVAGADASGTITLTGVYTVTFEVTEDDVPVQNANIEINNTFIATDVDGIATIDLDGGQAYPYTVIYSAYSEGDTINNLSADTTITINFTGINSVNALQFDVYPNPTSGQFTIEAQGQANVTIMNAAGKVVETMVINGTQQVNLNVASGVYFVRMKEADKVGVQRLIVE